MFTRIDQEAVNTIRTLSIDAIEKANSGHPGLPMGAAPMAYVLWTKFLKVNPTTSRNWKNRDRFVLSAGHGSALLYSLLHLSGYNVTLNDLKNFRQLNSLTPGHPEVNHTDGVEATTGPLGQGIAMAVGMAMAETHLAAKYNRECFPIVDHYTYALCGDGDLMEGVSQEAASLAGHLKLNKLIVLYDSNDISLDGPTSKAFTENVGKRFEAYGWEHILVKDGNNLDEIFDAIEKSKISDKPTLIEVKTIIGFGSKNQGTSKVHGSPLGQEDVNSVKDIYDVESKEPFFISNKIKIHILKEMEKGIEMEENWNSLFKKYKEEYPDLAKEYEIAHSDKLPQNWDANLPSYNFGESSASRVTSSETLQKLSSNIPFLWGGSADLSASNNTMILGESDYAPDNYSGKNIWFGVREFAMASIMNGIQLHGGSRIYGGTFFVFVDYLRAAIRLSALQKLPVIYVLTHDSIAVGEDGPTHEPVEQLASLRSMPNLNVIRPADGNETVEAWKIALSSSETPTVLALSRQNLPVIEGTKEKARMGVSKGAYVVSVPCFRLFDNQSDDYKESVLPENVKNRISIEMGASFGWKEFVGDKGKVLSIDRFGMSAPGNEIIEEYGFTVENIVNIYNLF